jgi:hypothetical protein
MQRTDETLRVRGQANAATLAAADAAVVAAASATAAANAVDAKIASLTAAETALQAKVTDAGKHAQQTTTYTVDGTSYPKGSLGWSQDASAARTGAETARDVAAGHSAAASVQATNAENFAAQANFAGYASTYATYANFNAAMPLANGVYLVKADETKGGTAHAYRVASGAVADSWGVVLTDAYGAAALIDRGAQIVNVKAFGAIGDGVADDAPAIQAAINAAATLGANVYIPGGTYRLNSGITSTDVTVLGAGGARTILEFYGAGTAVVLTTTRPGTVGSFRLVSKAAGQTGIRTTGEFPAVRDVRMEEFDFGLRVGASTGVSPSYYGTFRSVNIRTTVGTGTAGLSVFGGFPASNANTFNDIVVTGRFTTLIDLAGHGNTFVAGDVVAMNVEPVDCWRISGNGNRIYGGYFEPFGSSNPTRWINFTSASNGNRIADLYVSALANTNAGKLVDDGANNLVEVRPIGVNYPAAMHNSGSENLLPNSGFTAWAGAVPYGWANMVAGGTFAREATLIRGSRYSLKVTGTDADIALGCFPFSGVQAYNSLKQVPIEYMRGRTLTAGVWCYSTHLNTGNLRIIAGSASSGPMNHPGNGEWILLTASVRCPMDAAQVGIQLRSNAATGVAKLTGDIYFSDPFLLIGARLPNYAPRALNDSVAVMAGPMAWAPTITIAAGTTTPSVADGNLFKTANTSPTSITNFLDAREGQEIKIIAGDANTTINNNSSIRTTTAAHKALTQDVIYRFIRDGILWREF